MASEAEANTEVSPSVVVVAVDNGDHCVAAFEKAVAGFPKETTVYHIVHVRPEKEEFFLAPISPDFKRYSQEAELREQRHSEAVLSKFCQLAEAAGVQHREVELKSRPHWNVKNGDPREKLCKYCEDVEASVLVMGCNGMGPVQRILHSSVSSYCKHHACCAVITDGDNVEADGAKPQAAPIHA